MCKERGTLENYGFVQGQHGWRQPYARYWSRHIELMQWAYTVVPPVRLKAGRGRFSDSHLARRCYHNFSLFRMNRMNFV